MNMSQARIPLKAKNTNNENDTPKSLQLNQKENKLSQLIETHKTIRQGTLSSRSLIVKRIKINNQPRY